MHSLFATCSQLTKAVATAVTVPYKEEKELVSTFLVLFDSFFPLFSCLYSSSLTGNYCMCAPRIGGDRAGGMYVCKGYGEE